MAAQIVHSLLFKLAESPKQVCAGEGKQLQQVANTSDIVL